MHCNVGYYFFTLYPGFAHIFIVFQGEARWTDLLILLLNNFLPKTMSMPGTKISILFFNENKQLKFHFVSKLQSDLYKEEYLRYFQVTFYNLTKRSLTTLAQSLKLQSINALVMFTRGHLWAICSLLSLLFKAEFSKMLITFSLHRLQKSKQRTKPSLAENPKPFIHPELQNYIVSTCKSRVQENAQVIRDAAETCPKIVNPSSWLLPSSESKAHGYKQH